MKLLHFLKRELGSEAQAWVEEGIIEREQAERILARYGSRLPRPEDNSRGYYILLSLAAFFMGLSIILLMSHNWDEIPRGLRMAALIGVTAGANGMGVRCFQKEQESAGRVWFFLGSLLYGASIMLIAQIYHIGEHYPDGVYWWAMGILPLALLSQGALIMLLALALAGLWAFLEMSFLFFPATLPVFFLSGFWFSLRQRPSILVFMASIVMTYLYAQIGVSWLLTEDWALDSHLFTLFILNTGFLMLCYALGSWLEEQELPLRDYGLTLKIWVMRGGLFLLLLFSFEGVWREFLTLELEAPVAALLLTLTVLTGQLAVGWLRERGRSATSRELALRYASQLFFTTAWLLALGVSLLELRGDAALWMQVLDNLLLIVVSVWLILRAVQDALTHYFYTGVVLVLMTALLRYFDLIGDYIGGAVLFFVCSAILFAAARFWRRHMLRLQEAS